MPTFCGHDVTYKLGMPGRHMAINSLAVLAAAELAGADLALAALTLSQVRPRRRPRRAPARWRSHSGEATLIDESYNANPASMAAALNVLGQRRGRAARPADRGARRHARTRARAAPNCIAACNEAVKANAIDLVFCCGPMMRNLWDALSSGKRGGYAENSAALESQVVGAIRAGDVIMVKGSLGSRMKTIVTALEKRFPGNAALDDVAV